MKNESHNAIVPDAAQILRARARALARPPAHTPAAETLLDV